jgi:C-terminal peptidase prc
MMRPSWRGRILALLGLLSLACQTLMPAPSPTPTSPPGPTPTVLPASATPGATVVPPTSPTVTPTRVKLDPPSPVMRDRHRRIFREVWGTVERNYVYPDYNGVDWDAVREAFAPRVAAAPDDAAFWALMEEMVDRLEDEHSAFLSPEAVAEEDQAFSGDLDYVGIGAFIVVPDGAEYAVVLFPLPDSPAEAAGLLAHDRLLQIDGRPACCNPDGSHNLDALAGPEGTPVHLTVQQPDAAPRELTVVRGRIRGQVPVTRRLVSQGPWEIGYLLIPTLWDETVAERTREAWQGLVDAGPPDALVLDLRVNGGGAYTELYDLLSLFAQGEVGRFLRRGDTSSPLTITPAPIADSQRIPLVVLIGRDTESYAEVLAGALQAAGRARLVGQPTAGNVETVYPYDMEDGSRLWLAEETFVPPDGTRWEGQGVQPDVPVEGDWEDFTAADDPQLDAALDLLLRSLRAEE